MYKQIALIGALVLTAACASKQKVETTTAAKTDSKQVTQTSVTMSEEYKKSLLKQQQQKGMSCARSADVRTVEIQTQSPKGCELIYNKNKVAWSSHGEAHCLNVQKKIQANLEQAGFKCEEPTRASASEKLDKVAEKTPEKVEKK